MLASEIIARYEAYCPQELKTPHFIGLSMRQAYFYFI